MSIIKDIEIALRDGLIAELTDLTKQDQIVLSKALGQMSRMDEMIDHWRELAYEYRQVALDLAKAYDEQSYELERIKRGQLDKD